MYRSYIPGFFLFWYFHDNITNNGTTHKQANKPSAIHSLVNQDIF